VKFPECVFEILRIGPPVPTVRGSSFVETKQQLGANVPTQTCRIALEATVDAGTVAWSCVALMNVVERLKLPGQTVIVSPETKPVPLTVSVKLALPAKTEAGDILVNVRNGGMVIFMGCDGVPPGFVALILTGPGVCIRLGGRATSDPLKAPRLIPFQEIVTPCCKPEPLASRKSPANSPVAVYQLYVGNALVKVGTAGVVTIIKVSAFEGDPPGFVTVIDAVPAVAIKDAGTLAATKLE